MTEKDLQQENEDTPRGEPSGGSRSSAGRGGNPFFAALVILAILEGAVLAWTYARYYAQSLAAISLQDKLDRASSSLEKQGTELSRQTEMLGAMKREYVRTDGARRALETELAAGRNLVADLEAKLKAGSESEQAAKSRLGRQEQIASYLRDRLRESKTTELQMMERLEALIKTQNELQSRIETMRGAGSPGEPSEIPLAETVVDAGSTAEAPAPQGSGEITGQILILNDRYGFAILNLGSDDGLAAGDEGRVACEGSEAGGVRVKKLYNKMCLADLVPSPPEGKVAKGCTVTFTRALAAPPGS